MSGSITLGSPPSARHRVAHRGEVDDGGDAGEVLQQDARRREGDLARRLGARVPGGDGLDVGGRHRLAVLAAQQVLEQDPQRVGEPRDVEAALQRIEAEDLVAGAPDRQGGAGSEGVGVGHCSSCRAGVVGVTWLEGEPERAEVVVEAEDGGCAPLGCGDGADAVGEREA